MTERVEETDPTDERPHTAPEQFSVCIRCFDTEERATKFGQLVGAYIREISRHIDLSGLDGITIAADYNQALLELDRGYETSYQLTPSDEYAIGVAMTPSVIRDTEVRSHIVMNAAIAVNLESSGDDKFRLALHMLAHECAHVEVTKRFDSTFPGFLLKFTFPNAHEANRWHIISSCWDEYAATMISARFGRDPTNDYEEIFVEVLADARNKANEQIKAYRWHSDVDRVLSETYGVYGNLMKTACYHLGNMAGHNLSIEDLPKTLVALDGHWFNPFFERLGELCDGVAAEYGEWRDMKKFDEIGDLMDEIIKEGGLTVSNLDDGEIYVDVPFTPETMPI